MNTNIVLFHHIDDDGYQAAYYCIKLIKYIYKDYFLKLYPINYPDPFPMNTVPEDSIVFFVDVSFAKSQANTLRKICDKATRVTWIDHHASSLDTAKLLSDVGNLTKCINTAGSGSLLTYIYYSLATGSIIPDVRLGRDDNKLFSKNFIENVFKSIKEDEAESNREYCRAVYTLNNENKANEFFIRIPTDIFFVDDYDRWVKGCYRTDYFILGIGSVQDKDPESINSIWTKLDLNGEETPRNDIFTAMISRGKAIKEYLDKRYSQELEEDSFVANIEGIETLCQNNHGNSWVFGEKIHDYKMVCLFHYSGKERKFVYSLYSDENRDDAVNCRAIAEKFGGGGHPHASGFKSDKLILKPIEANDTSDN